MNNNDIIFLLKFLFLNISKILVRILLVNRYKTCYIISLSKETIR